MGHTFRRGVALQSILACSIDDVRFSQFRFLCLLDCPAARYSGRLECGCLYAGAGDDCYGERAGCDRVGAFVGEDAFGGLFTMLLDDS